VSLDVTKPNKLNVERRWWNFSSRDISAIPTTSLQGSNISKVGLIFDFDALQCWNEATYLTCESWLGSAYDTRNTSPQLSELVIAILRPWKTGWLISRVFKDDNESQWKSLENWEIWPFTVPETTEPTATKFGVVPNLKFIASVVPEIWRSPKILKVRHVSPSRSVNRVSPATPYLNFPTPICLFTMQHSCSYNDD